MGIQSDFDQLVCIVEAYFRASAFSAEERALAEQIERARERDDGCLPKRRSGWPFDRVAPPGLEWR
jgi:hypothetical protein